ncbi:MAG: solute carrier family 23 protein [Caulobacteraceae bacterium]
MSASEAKAVPGRPVFDVSVNDKVGWKDAIPMGFQNVFVMTGIFVFPGIMGRTFNLPPETIAYLYGATFIGCGVTSVLISMVLGRMPLVAGPYAGIFTALLTFGKMKGGGLDAAFGSLCVASLLWCVLSIPIRGWSVVGWVSKVVRTPVIAGVIVMLVMMQVADLSFPHWLGKPEDGKAFPLLLNFGTGLITALVLMILICAKQPMVRRLALLISLVAGAALFEAFHPINFGMVAKSPWLVTPKLFPFGLAFNPEFCLVYFAILVAVNVQTMTLMGVVGEWAHEPMPPARLSKGVLAMMLGSAIASCIGSFSNLPYPANIAILRSTRVASRWVTMTTGLILIAMGFCTKVDYVFVLLPTPVLSAAATVLFGIVFVHGVEMLAKVHWDERSLAIAGFSLMLGFGSLFVDKETLSQMPLFVRLMLGQPIIVGVFSVLLLTAVLPGRVREAKKGQPLAAPEPATPASSHAA